MLRLVRLLRLVALFLLAGRLTHRLLRRVRELPRFLRPRRAGVGFFFLQPILKLLQLVLEALRAIGELLGFGFLIVLRFRARGVRERLVAIRDLLRFVLERLHRAFERRALQHFGALLELLAQLLLHRLKILQRLLRLLARQLLRRVLELLHLRHELWRQRVSQQLLRFLKLPREAAVERTRLFELLLDCGGSLLELLHLIGEVSLILGDGLRLLGRVVAHRALLAVRVVRVARRILSGLPLLRPIARRVVRPLLERLLRGGRGLRLADGRIHRGTRDGAAFLHRRDL